MPLSSRASRVFHIYGTSHGCSDDLDVVKSTQMGDLFEGDKGERDERKNELNSFQAKFAGLERPAAPLRRGLVAQAPDPDKGCQADEGSDQRKCQHGNSNRVGMNAIPDRSELGNGGNGPDAEDQVERPEHGKRYRRSEGPRRKSWTTR